MTTGIHRLREKLAGSITIIIKYPGAKGIGINPKIRLTIKGICVEVNDKKKSPAEIIIH
jgi:hypothetical protein